MRTYDVANIDVLAIDAASTGATSGRKCVSRSANRWRLMRVSSSLCRSIHTGGYVYHLNPSPRALIIFE